MSEKLRSENAEDLQRLRAMLRKVTSGDADEAKRHLEGRSKARILDLACGECREADLLVDFVAELTGKAHTDVSLTGIDVRAREIEDARRYFQQARQSEAPVNREFEFLTGDASRLDAHSELGDEFDLVFMRHQNYWNGAKTWEQIYDHALSKLDDDGRLIITSYFDREHDLALEAIQRLGGELIETSFNTESRNLTTVGKSVDRHVAMFRRKREKR